MNRAQYNITDDRFKFWPAERLSPSDYAEAKACKFVWFPGQKCFSAIWRPQAEDFLARLGLEIEDVCEVDDVAARVERFDRYASNAESTAQSAADRLESGKANTERRQRLAENVAAREFGTAAHWQRRIAGAIRHAQHKEDAGAIYRRISTLETDLRRWTVAQEVHEIPGSPGQVWVGGMGRGQGYWHKPEEVPALVAYAKRWAEHIEHRLEYERARLAATGSTLAKLASNELTIEKGGAVKLSRRRVAAEGWYFITKVNPASVEVYSPHEPAWRGKFIKIPRDELGELATAAQVAAGEIRCEVPPELPKVKAAPVKSRDGKRPELFGAFGSSGGFVDKLEDCRWFLIVKVNRSTVEYLSKQETIRGDNSKGCRYFVNKCDISGLSFVKTPAQVKAEHPELLADWAKVEEIRAKRAAMLGVQQEASA